MRTHVTIDLNVRVSAHETVVGVEDILGPICQGGLVTVQEQESGVEGEGRISRIDLGRGVVYVELDWTALRVRDDMQSANDALAKTNAKFEEIVSQQYTEPRTYTPARSTNIVKCWGETPFLPDGAYVKLFDHETDLGCSITRSSSNSLKVDTR